MTITKRKQIATKHLRMITARALSHHSIDPPEEGVRFGKSAAALDVLVIHEDLPTSLRAKFVVDRLEAEIGIKARIHYSWQLETLNDLTLRKIALQSARSARILFLSLHGDCEFSPIVCAWLDELLRTRDMGPCALVLSLDGDAKGSVIADSMLAYVRKATASSDVEVFAHFEQRTPKSTAPNGWMIQNSEWPSAMNTPSERQTSRPPVSHLA